MTNTMAFVTSQFSCDRIISAGRQVAEKNGCELVVVGILDAEYTLNPEAIDYLFSCSKKNNAVMRLLFEEDKVAVMRGAIQQYECRHVVTGMPNSSSSVLYDLWKDFGEKFFYVVDEEGKLVEVARDVEHAGEPAKRKAVNTLFSIL